MTGASSDKDAPEIKSLEISAHDAVVGDVITVTAEVEDASELDSYFSIAMTNGSSAQYANFKKQESGKYEASFIVTDTYINGTYSLSWISVSDVLGNGGLVSGASSKYPQIYFYVYANEFCVNIGSLDGVTVYTSNTTISSQIINGDVYIGPKAVVTMKNCTVNGNIYVLGGLRLAGVTGKSLYANSMVFYSSSTFSQGMVQVTGSNTFSGSMQFETYPVADIPIRVDSVQTVDGLLYMSGAVADIADMYIGDTQIDISNNGKFVVEDYNLGAASKVTLTWKTVFGNTITKDYNVEVVSKNPNGTVNYKPSISAGNITCCVGQNIDLLKNVSAYDKEDGLLTKKISVDSTKLDITKAGEYSVKYSVVDSNDVQTDKEIKVYVNNHNYINPVFKWTEDGKSCKVTYTCEDDESHTIEYDATVTSEVKTEATCTTKGTTTYTAKYGSDTDSKDVQDIAVDASNHAGETEIRDKVEATCGAEGYTGDTYCKGCGEKISTGKVEAKKAHNYANPEFKWSEDGKSCEVTYTCENDASHKIEYEATVTSEVKTEATCITKGTTTYTAKYGSDTDSRDVQDIAVDASKHAGGTEIKNKIEATCGAEGYTGDTYCKGCGEKISTGEIVEKKDHNYANPVFKWTEDGKSCKVTYTCENDASHKIEYDAAVTSEVKTEATCTTKGTTTYTARYGSDTDSKDVQDIAVDASNHVWEKDYTIDVPATKTTNGSKSIHCKNCEAKKNVTVIQATGSGEKVVEKTQKITTVKLKTYKAKSLKRKKVVFSLKAKTSGNGKLTYKVTKGKSKYITVSKTGKVTLKKGCRKGTYKITITASATEKYKAATKVISIKVK